MEEEILKKQQEIVANANALAFQRMTTAEPKLESIQTAKNVIPDMDSRTLLHSGPPIPWKEMPGATRGALIGAMIYEGWVATEEEAIRKLDDGFAKIEACCDHNAVGPMAGVISPSMPVFVISDDQTKHTVFSTINEGLGKVLRFGGLGDEVIRRLKWIEKTVGPSLDAALSRSGPIKLKPIVAESIRRGDEVHNRNKSATSSFYMIITPHLVATEVAKETVIEIMKFIADNVHFFLNISMGAAKIITLAAHNISNSSIVTTMITNGVEFGIKVSGTGEKWFKASAPMVDAKYFKGFSSADASPQLGDSSIIETAGYGAFALAASPAIVEFIGGTVEYAIEITNRMKKICYGSSPDFLIPVIGYAGTGTGIDVLKVCETGIAPMMDAGVAHKIAGKGQIGAGIVTAPLTCFQQARAELARSVNR